MRDDPEERRTLPPAPAPLRVAYQGVEGSFSHLAAERRYGARPAGARLAGHVTFREAVEAVKTGAADLAFLPIENSTAGAIDETLDLVVEGGVTIAGEAMVPVEHCLLALPGARLEEIRAVLSHPQALAQCDAFLRARPDVERRVAYDTAGAARSVRDAGDRALAAIASESAAAIYGLEVLRRGVQTQAHNVTRFVELARGAASCRDGVPCKTSLHLVLRHEPGALAAALAPLARRGVNLTRIESRPIPAEPWRYRFLLDVEGHAESDAVRDALADIGREAAELRVLGTYPRAEEA